MNAQLRRRLERATRSAIFSGPSDGGSRSDGADAARGAADAGGGARDQQRAGWCGAGVDEQRAEVRRALQGKLLRYLTGVGAVAAKRKRELGAQFRLPRTRATKPGVRHAGAGDAREGDGAQGPAGEAGSGGGVLGDIVSASRVEQTLEVMRAGASTSVRAGSTAVASEITTVRCRRSGALGSGTTPR